MNKKLFLFSSFAILLALPVIVGAQNIPNIPQILNNIINWIVLPIFMGLIVIMFVWAGILYLTARAEPGQIQKANHMIIWALIGTAVGLLAWSVAGLLILILGI